MMEIISLFILSTLGSDDGNHLPVFLSILGYDDGNHQPAYLVYTRF